jgi:hypothetical protein
VTAPRDPARAEAAGMAALIERAEADLALAEEPSRFIAALESGAPAAGAQGQGRE